MKPPADAESQPTCLAAIDIDSTEQSICNVDISVREKTLEELKTIPSDVTSVAIETHPEIKDLYLYATYFHQKLYQTPELSQSK
jgi:hypothetical protein